MDVRALQQNVRDALARRFGIDERALAALRVSLGLVLLADLFVRSRDLVAFYTDFGVLPRTVLREQFPALARLSLHAVSGSAWVQGLLFLVAGAAAAALLLGYRTRLATVVSFVLLVSLHARNPVILNAGDSILRRLLFWGAFLPLGGRWSVDALRSASDSPENESTPSLRDAFEVGRDRRLEDDHSRSSTPGDDHRRTPDRCNSRRTPTGRNSRQTSAGSNARRIVSVASAALLIQVVLVYAANAAFKLRGDQWLRGEAIRYAFSLEQLTTQFGELLAEFPVALTFFDRVWLGLLVASVALIALTGTRRAVFASVFVGMHLGMALTMRLGIFPFVSIAGLLAFLPPRFWDAVAKLRATPVGRALDLGERLLRRADRLLRRVERGVSALNPTHDRKGDREDERGQIARRGGGFTDRLRPLGRWTRRSKPAVVAGLLALILVWNAATLGVVALPDGASSTVDPEEYRWDMFAPEPRATDGWYVVPAELSNGERRDALHGRAVSWDQPPDVTRTSSNVRWYKYLVDLQRSDYATLRPYFTDYLCRRWSATHETEIQRLTVYYVEQPTRLNGPEPTERVEQLRYSCATGVLKS